MKAIKLFGKGVCSTATLGVSLLAAQAASAGSSLDSLEALNQSQFVEFSENLTAATSYKSIAPSEPLGILGFDLGFALSSTEIDSDLFDLASGGSVDEAELIMAKVQVQKGLPFGIDLGASLSAIPEADATVLGGELRYAIVDGGALTPSISLRASYSQLQGVDDFSIKSGGLGVGISKGFLFLTPYASAGIIRTTVDPKNIAGLSSETFDQRQFVLGATINIGFALTLEADRTGDYRTYSAKVGVRF